MTRKGSVLAKYEAVIFDLYGTLVDSSLHEFKGCVENISQLLGVEPKAFAEGFTQRFIEFELGTLDISQLVRAAAAGPGIQPTSQQLEIAGSLWADTVLASLRPRPDYIAALRAIKERGVRTGLITNCAPPTGEVWVQTEFKHCFDVTLFS